MFPGLTTKLSEKTVASAATIVADADVLFVTGSTQIDDIVPKTGGFSQLLGIVPVSGSLTLSSSGNIAVGDALSQNRLTWLIYSKERDSWYIADAL